MSSFLSVPYADILTYLESNGIIISKNKLDNYHVAWNSLLINPTTSVPISIADFIIALNLSGTSTIPMQSSFEILTNISNKDLPFTLEISSDKERMIRILGYLGKISDNYTIFQILPKEILEFILLKLDCQTIHSFSQVSKKLTMIFSYKEVLRERLQRVTRRNLKDYSLEKLETLCKFERGTHISAGSLHTLIRNHKGEVFSCGYNKYGQLGTGDNEDRNIPTLIFKNAREISAGGDSSLVLNDQRQVYSFGMGGLGQLGITEDVGKDFPVYANVNTPFLIPKLENIIHLSISGYHSLALNNEGQVYSFGYSGNGQLGLGYFGINKEDRTPVIVHQNNYTTDVENRMPIPMIIPNTNNIIAVGTSDTISLLLNGLGHVFSFGLNSDGRLGLGDEVTRSSPTRINIENIIKISTKGRSSLLLNENGQVFAFGESAGLVTRMNYGTGKSYKTRFDTEFPELITGIENIVAVTVGNDHFLLLTEKGQVYAFGSNDYGQLGQVGKNYIVEPTIIPGLNNIVEIAAGDYNSFAVNCYGEVYTFGRNDYGQLGLGHKNKINVPTLIPELNVFKKKCVNIFLSKNCVNFLKSNIFLSKIV